MTPSVSVLSGCDCTTIIERTSLPNAQAYRNGPIFPRFAVKHEAQDTLVVDGSPSTVALVSGSTAASRLSSLA